MGFDINNIDFSNKGIPEIIKMLNDNNAKLIMSGLSKEDKTILITLFYNHKEQLELTGKDITEMFQSFHVMPMSAFLKTTLNSMKSKIGDKIKPTLKEIRKHVSESEWKDILQLSFLPDWILKEIEGE